MTRQLGLRVMFGECDCAEWRQIRHESTIYVHARDENEALAALLALKEKAEENWKARRRYFCICVPGRGHAIGIQLRRRSR